MTAELPGRAFRKAFARRPVEALADRRSFERGLLYAANGRVGKQTVSESSVKAKVCVSSSYQVTLWLDDDGQSAFDCSCPVGEEGRFCKHGVAVALVATEAVADPRQRAEAVVDIRAYLAGLDHDALVDLLVEHAGEDEHFDARLRMAAARATQGGPSIAVFRHALDEAFMVHDYVDYREIYGYATNIESVLDPQRWVRGHRPHGLVDPPLPDGVRILAR